LQLKLEFWILNELSELATTKLHSANESFGITGDTEVPTAEPTTKTSISSRTVGGKSVDGGMRFETEAPY
jgi:hypothetical protein